MLDGPSVELAPANEHDGNYDPDVLHASVSIG
jgi:hypothetical protein